MATAPKTPAAAPKPPARPPAAKPAAVQPKADEKVVSDQVDEDAEIQGEALDEGDEAAGADRAPPGADPNSPAAALTEPPNGAPAAPSPQPAKMVVPGAPLLPENAYPGEETITMVSPRAFYLLLDDQRRVAIKEGPQEIPVRLKDHPYLRDHGVKVYGEKA